MSRCGCANLTASCRVLIVRLSTNFLNNEFFLVIGIKAVQFALANQETLVLAMALITPPDQIFHRFKIPWFVHTHDKMRCTSFHILFSSCISYEFLCATCTLDFMRISSNLCAPVIENAHFTGEGHLITKAVCHIRIPCSDTQRLLFATASN